MATVEDELAALKDMLDNDVIDASEYVKMSEEARARHAGDVVWRQPASDASQSQQAQASAPSASTRRTQTAETSSVGAKSSKSKLSAALLALFLGVFGAQKFYLGYTREGVILLAITFLGALIGIGPFITGLVGLAEFFIYLTRTEEDFRRTYVEGHKSFF